MRLIHRDELCASILCVLAVFCVSTTWSHVSWLHRSKSGEYIPTLNLNPRGVLILFLHLWHDFRIMDNAGLQWNSQRPLVECMYWCLWKYRLKWIRAAQAFSGIVKPKSMVLFLFRTLFGDTFTHTDQIVGVRERCKALTLLVVFPDRHLPLNAIFFSFLTERMNPETRGTGSSL